MKTNKKNSSVSVLLKSTLYVFAAIGFMCILLMFLASKMIFPNMDKKIVVEDNSVLVIDFNQDFSEIAKDDIISGILGESSISLYNLLNIIEAAQYDEKITAILGLVDSSDLGAAQIDDVRNAIKRFRSGGKKAYVYSQGFGTLGGGLSEYYLATAFDEIIMQPKAMLGITGIGIEVPFFKDILQKLGVKPEFYARYEYKNAISSLIDAKMSKEYREQLQNIADSFGNYMLEKISQERNIGKEKLQDIMNNAPIFAEDALNTGLIDKIKYKAEFYAELEDKPLVSAEDYALGVYVRPAKNKIAIMFLEGVILDGKSQAEKINSEAVIGEDSVLEDISAIAKRDDIKALVVRVNSPGGSYGSASEIWYALKNLKETKKIPLIVSQGDYAASGGYFISLPADYIYAEPMTLTGSIGAFGGKIVVSELMKKLQINWEGTYFGNNAGIDSYMHNFNAKEKEIFNKSLDIIYDDFTEKVEKARNIAPEEMDKLARGRVWTGAQAVENGLADKTGGLLDAIVKAAELAKLTEYEPETFPKKQSLEDKIAEFISEKTNISVEKILSAVGMKKQDITILKNIEDNMVYSPIRIKM